MDLNKSMAELYKKRATASKQKATPFKQPAGEGAARKKSSWLTEELKAEYVTKISMDQLYGCQEAADEVKCLVNHFKAANSHYDLSPILICGSRGLGKTSIVEAAANYSELKIIKVPLRELATTRRGFRVALKKMIELCETNQPVIILIDDLEELDGKEDLKALLQFLIGKLLKRRLKVLFICTAISVDSSFSHLEFSASIQLKRPDVVARYQILDSHRTCPSLSKLTNEDIKSLAVSTPSFSGSDIRKLFTWAEAYAADCKPTLVDCQRAVDKVKSSFKKGTRLIGERPPVTWEMIGGLTEVREAFLPVLNQIRSGDIDCKFGGLLLYGPPGCGKTMVAQAMANEAGLNFIAIKPTELKNKYLGETERNIRQVFSEAKEYEPCMIYFDEFDGLCGTRGDKHDLTGAIPTLLSEMDGFDGRGKSIILASTNRLEDIDPAIKRPGRLTKHIYVGPPNEEARRDILKVITSKSLLASDVDLNLWAKKTEKFTGADLAHLVDEAEKFASSSTGKDKTSLTLRHEHFDEAFIELRKKSKVRAHR